MMGSSPSTLHLHCLLQRRENSYKCRWPQPSIIPTPAPEPEPDNEVLDDSAFLVNIDVDIFNKQSANKHRLPKTREHYSINFEYDMTDATDPHHDDIALADISVLIASLSDMHDVPGAQRQCPDFTDFINYLTPGLLPDKDTDARRITAESEHYTILDDTLFHLHRPCTKGKDRVTPVVQQLCLPRILRDEVIKAYHDHNGHINFDKLYETIRNKYFWPHMYRICEDL